MVLDLKSRIFRVEIDRPADEVTRKYEYKRTLMLFGCTVTKDNRLKGQSQRKTEFRKNGKVGIPQGARAGRWLIEVSDLNLLFSLRSTQAITHTVLPRSTRLLDNHFSDVHL